MEHAPFHYFGDNLKEPAPDRPVISYFQGPFPLRNDRNRGVGSYLMNAGNIRDVYVARLTPWSPNRIGTWGWLESHSYVWGSVMFYRLSSARDHET